MLRTKAVLALEADHTNTSLASAYVFDATSARELHSRPQNPIATPLSKAEYRRSALTHTIMFTVNVYCGFLIVRRPRPSTTGKNCATMLWQENGCQPNYILGS